MRPTIERAYWSRDFETAEDRKPTLGKQGRGIATRVTRGGVRECKPRQGRGWRAERELVVAEKWEDDGNSDGFIHDVRIRAPIGYSRYRLSTDMDWIDWFR